MAKIIDMTKQKIGLLTVLEKAEKRGSDGSVMWVCECECGKLITVNGSNLRNGHTRSCGCVKKQTAKENGKNLIKDLSKQRFGKLTVLEATDKRVSGSVIWKCQCDCGKIAYVSAAALKNGTQSCGCKLKERIIDLSGQTFGYIKVIEDDGTRTSDRAVKWKSECTLCGKIFYIRKDSLDRGQISCGCSKQSKGEYKISQILKENNIDYITEYSFDTCYFSDTDKKAYFDFFVNNQYLIEFDGEQHFHPVNIFGGEDGFKKRKERDTFKNQWCKENNIPLIRIPYLHLNDLSLKDLLLETSTFRVI